MGGRSGHFLRLLAADGTDGGAGARGLRRSGLLGRTRRLRCRSWSWLASFQSLDALEEGGGRCVRLRLGHPHDCHFQCDTGVERLAHVGQGFADDLHGPHQRGGGGLGGWVLGAQRGGGWVRLLMVGSTFCGSVVARTKTTWPGGSSSVFRRALAAAVESMWTSSTMYTFQRPGVPRAARETRSRMASTPLLEAASSS